MITGDTQVLKKHSFSSTLILICGILATGIGFVALLGWLAGLPILSSLGSGRIPMAPSTALLFLLYGAGVLLLSRLSPGRAAFRIGMVIGAAGAMSALLLFILSSMNIHLQAEHLGIRIAGTLDGVPIGHISPVTAFCFILVGLSFLASLSSSTGRTRQVSVAFWSSVLVLLSSVVLLLAYFLGSPLLYGSSVIPPALPTSLAFLLLGTALLVYSGQRLRPFSSMSDMAETRPTYVLIMIFILLFSGIVTAGYLYLRNYEKEYRNGVEQQLSSVASLKVSDLVQYRKERWGDAFLIFKNDQFSGLVRRFLTNPEDAQGRIQIHSWLKKLQEYYQYDQVRLMDAGGVTRLSVPAGLQPVSAVISQRVSDVLRTREIALQDFYLNEYDHRPYLTLLVPILDANSDKRPIGVVTLRINPETYLYPFISLWPSPSRTAETLIVRREGRDILFLNELRFRKNTALKLRIPLERKEVVSVQAALGRNGIVEGLDYAGVKVVAYVRAVPDSPWVIIARMNAEEIYAPLRKQLWTIIALIAALLIGTGSGVALLWRQQHVRFYQERYAAAEELRKSERLLSESQRLGHVGSFLYDKTGRLSWSEELYRLYGVSPDTFTPTEESFLRLMHPDDLPAMQFWMAACATGKKPDALDFRINMPDGTIRFVRGWGDAVHDAENKLTYIAGTVQDITKQKQAEEALREKEEFTREVLNSMDFSVAVLDRDGHITTVNKEWERFAQQNGGAPEKTGLGVNYLDTCRADAPEALAGLQAVLSGEREHFDLEYPCHSPEEKRWFAMRTSPLSKQRGGLIVAHMNITEQKQAEETIKKNLQIQNILNSLLKVSLEGIPLKELLAKALDIVLSVPFLPLMPKGGIFIVEDDPAVLVLTVNRGFSLTIQEICDRVPFGRCLCGRAAASRQIQFADGMDERHENSYDGITDHGHYNVPILSMGKVLGVLVLYLQEGHQQEESEFEFLQAVANAIAGIIERKHLENALRKFNEELTEKVTERTAGLEKANTELKKLFNAIEQTEELIVITDAKGAIEYVNPAFTRKTGYSREEAIGKNPRMLQSGLTPIEIYNELWKTILSGNPWKGTFINRKKSGELYYEYATIAPVLDEHGKITHFVAAKTDVTDRIMAEKELKRKNSELELAKETAESANRAKSEFLANMSHELRTPLNSIIGFSEILKDGMAGQMPDNQKELLNDISTSGKRLLSLINDILDLSKAEAGQMELELSEFNLEGLINGSLVMFNEKAIKHNIKIVAEVEAVIGNIIADERKVKQVLFNLLSNAVKFTPEGGSVRVQARRVHSSQFTVHGEKKTVKQYCEPSTVNREPADFIEVSVTDTGIGIAPEDREKLFQPFQQIDSALSRKYSGTGLGLNLCKQFIELHGGRIWIENEVERGSRFVFLIPLKKEGIDDRIQKTKNPDSR